MKYLSLFSLLMMTLASFAQGAPQPPAAIDMKASKIYAKTQSGNIKAMIKDHKVEVSECFKNYQKFSSSKGGKIIIQVTVNDTGTVLNTSEKKNSFKDKDLYDCVVSSVKSWGFPAAPTGKVVTVDYPFEFTDSTQ